MCLYPSLMINKKYTPTKKNGGYVPSIKDDRTRYVPIGCGRCIECLKQKSNAWKIRMHEELRINNIATFVTLTFSDENLTKLASLNNICNPTQNNDIAIIATRLFLERWRKKHKKSIKHWLITELGHKNTERIHLHGIIWTDKKQDIEKIWQYGWVYIGDYVNEKTINYIIKYVTKIDQQHRWFKPKILCSPGIGKNYINTHNSKIKKFKGENTDESYNYNNGNKGSLPTYYRNKIYSEEEREQLWINRLNKEIRYVRGTEVSIKNGLDEYYKIRNYHRERNRQMGYGYKDVPEEIYKKKIEDIKKFTTIANNSHTHTSEASDNYHNNTDLESNLNF